MARGAAYVTLAGCTVLVTGASGFLGGRVVERLVRERGVRPRCLVRGYGRVARIARFPVDLRIGDVLDPPSLDAAVAGCDLVVHCAFGNGGDDAQNTRINTVGTRLVAEAALKHGVRRIVHISTVEVYGVGRPECVTETTPLGAPENSYGASKREGEEIILDLHRNRGLPAVVLRPAVVYGAFAPVWTIGIADRLLNHAIVQSEEFDGVCNPIYIDDLVDAVFLATSSNAAVGEIFNIASGERLTWNTYFGQLNGALGLPALPRRGRGALRRYHAVRRALAPALRLVRARYGARAVALYQRLRDAGRIPNVKTWMQRGALVEDAYIYGSRAYYDITKARNVLGFTPRHDLAKGTQIVAEWLRHTGRGVRE